MHAAAKLHSIWLHWAISLRCRQKAKKRQASSLLAHIAKKPEPGENKQHYRSRNSHSLHFNRKKKSHLIISLFVLFFFFCVGIVVVGWFAPINANAISLPRFFFILCCVCVLFCSYNTNTHAWHCRIYVVVVFFSCKYCHVGTSIVAPIRRVHVIWLSGKILVFRLAGLVSDYPCI